MIDPLDPILLLLKLNHPTRLHRPIAAASATEDATGVQEEMVLRCSKPDGGGTKVRECGVI